SLPQVLLVGGPAGDDELLGVLLRSLPADVPVGRGSVGGTLDGPPAGHRYAAAVGLGLAERGPAAGLAGRGLAAGPAGHAPAADLAGCGPAAGPAGHAPAADLAGRGPAAGPAGHAPGGGPGP